MDSGKSSFAKILLGLTATNGLRPTFVDLNVVRQGTIPIICSKSEPLQSDLMESGAKTLVKKRTLYPPIEPYNSRILKVSDIHSLLGAIRKTQWTQWNLLIDCGV